MDYENHRRKDRVHAHPRPIRGPRPDPGSSYLQGHDDGFRKGSHEGYERGRRDGFAQGLEEGIGIGVKAGFTDALEVVTAVVDTVRSEAGGELVKEISRRVARQRLGTGSEMTNR